MSLPMESSLVITLFSEASTRERVIHDSRPGNTISGNTLEEYKVTHIRYIPYHAIEGLIMSEIMM